MRKIVAAAVLIMLLVSGAAAETLTLPTELSIIKAGAFQGNTAVTQIVFGKNLTSIGNGAFADCTALDTVNLNVDSLEKIGESAFEGDTAITEIHFGSGLKSIGEYAFRGCTGLKSVYFDNSDVDIAENAFGDRTGIVFYLTTDNSKARAFAEKHGFICPKYKALLIGLDYEDTIFEISGPREDAEYMGTMLQNLKGISFETTVLTDKGGKITESDIQNAIKTTFAENENCDVSLFFFSGHGVTNTGNSTANGALFLDYHGTDGSGNIKDMEYISGAELKEMLDQYCHGKKIVIIDACNSGNFVNRSGTDSNQTIVNSLVQPFELVSRAGEFKKQDYYVIAACKKTEDSYSLKYEETVTEGGEEYIQTSYYGLMTAALMEGIGYDRLNKGAKTGDCPADKDGDGMLTMNEVFVYTRDHVNSKRKKYNSDLRDVNKKTFAANEEFAVMNQLSKGKKPSAADETKYNTEVQTYNNIVNKLISKGDVRFKFLKSLCVSQTVQSFPDKSYQEPANTSPDDVIFIP